MLPSWGRRVQDDMRRLLRARLPPTMITSFHRAESEDRVESVLAEAEQGGSTIA
ncbi:MAG: hypothetical protein ABI912_08285 [Actinomycetota bacterium]